MTGVCDRPGTWILVHLTPVLDGHSVSQILNSKACKYRILSHFSSLPWLPPVRVGCGSPEDAIARSPVLRPVRGIPFPNLRF